MKNVSFLLVLLSITFFIISCSNNENNPTTSTNQEDCEELANLGFIELEETSKSFIPYPRDINRVIMKDSLGNEYVGEVSKYNEVYDPTILGGIDEECPLDPSILIEYNYKPEYIRLVIEFPTIDTKLSLLLGTTVANSSYQDKLIADNFSINANRPMQSSGSNANMLIVVNQRTHPNPVETYSEYQDTYQLGNKTFEEVYINSIELEEEFEIIYNRHIGLIRLRSESPEIDLIFDRIE